VLKYRLNNPDKHSINLPPPCCVRQFFFVMSTIKHSLAALAACAFLSQFAACNGNNQTADEQPKETKTTAVQAVIPAFNEDSAYSSVTAQVAFGPRTPGSAAQKQCADWMQSQLKKFCDTVYRQEATVKGGDGKSLPCINIIGAINPQAKRRILLLAHWDSRPWADNDVTDKDKPILAADDGGSGVGVLIEVARALKGKPLPQDLGVDILFTDVEDYGKTEWGEDTYCLGTQCWARNPHVGGYKAEFGILLDMVGGRNARFPMEATSAQYAGNVQQNIWQSANKAGYSSFFPFTQGGGVTDDHVYVNTLAHIPTVDIISLTENTTSGFPAHWHTHKDNMEVIDKSTLKAVGQTLLQVIYDAAQPPA